MNNNSSEINTTHLKNITEQIVDRPRGPEKTVDFARLQQTAEALSETWQKDGFNNPSRYLDDEGNLVLVASEVSESEITQQEGKTWRLLVGDETVTVTVPPALRGEDTYHDVSTPSGIRHYLNRQSIYDIRFSDDLPSELRPLIMTFGDTLFQDEIEPGIRVLRNAPGGNVLLHELDAVQAEVTRFDQEVKDEAWDQAHLAERMGQEAKGLVGRGLFRGAEKLAALREQAYRDEIAYQNRMSNRS